jgi:hypothetical protein
MLARRLLPALRKSVGQWGVNTTATAFAGRHFARLGRWVTGAPWVRMLLGPFRLSMGDDTLDESLIYRSGTPYQRWAYEHAARYFHAQGVRRYGVSSRGNTYAHLLHPDDWARNFLTPAIAEAVAARFDSHKAGDRARTETNAVASQPCCFNLFVPLAQDLRLASVVLSNLMGRALHVDHIEIEFTPNRLRRLAGYDLGDEDESLGDQTDHIGTDADVAVFYQTQEKRGVLLVEFKYVESEFSTCGSYHSTTTTRTSLLRPVCNSPRFVPLVTEARGEDRTKPYCGYSKYSNWDLTKRSAALDWLKISTMPGCPFSGSAQQLWRNMLLAEQVARHRGLQHFGLWIIAPKANRTLWAENGRDVFNDFARLLRSGEEGRFQRFNTEAIVDVIDAQLQPGDARKRLWVDAFRQRYLPQP